MLKKFSQNGGQSPADINSDNFDRSLLTSKAKKVQTSNYSRYIFTKMFNYLVTVEPFDVDPESEQEADVKDRKNRKRSGNNDQSFVYTESSFRRKKSKEIAK